MKHSQSQRQRGVRHRIDGLEKTGTAQGTNGGVRHRIDGLEKPMQK